METRQASELIEKSNHVGIALPPNADLDALCAAEALLHILLSMGKVPGMITPLQKDTFSIYPQLQKIAEAKPLIKEFIITLDTHAAPLSQLRYENNEHGLDIVLSPKIYSLNAEDVSFRQGSVQCDCIVSLGIPDIKTLDSDRLDLPASFFENSPIINIDSSSKNTGYGAANLIDEHKLTLAEITYALACTFTPSALTPEIATILLAGIIAKTDNFRNTELTAQTFLTCHELMDAHASYPDALTISASHRSVALQQLLGRTAVRSRSDAEKGVLWSFITDEDFLKTGRSESDLPEVARAIKYEFPPHRVSVLLWQNPFDALIRARISGEHALLETLAMRTGTVSHNPHLEIAQPFHSFTDAETAITQLLADAL